MPPLMSPTRLGRRLALAAAVSALSLGAIAEASAQKMRGPGLYGQSKPPGGGGRWEGRRPTHPGVRPGGRGPNWGAIGAGVAAGVVLGTIAAHANRAPPPEEFDDPPPRLRPRGQPPGRNAAPPPPRVSINIPPAAERRFLPDEVVLEMTGQVPPQRSAAIAARHRLTRVESAYFPSLNTTYFRWRIADRRSVPAVLRQLGREGALRSAQPNYIYTLSQREGAGGTVPAADTPPVPADAGAPDRGPAFVAPAPDAPQATPVAAAAGAMPAAGDPGQYTLSKLRLAEAHGLARGTNVLVAVIDSGVDAGHPELSGVIAGTFDAVGSVYEPHAHGTAIAGAIAARSRLMGVAPAARILAIRAFGATGQPAEATTFAIIKGVDHAVSKGARVINMSFAGPSDPALSRSLAAARAKGAVLVAAMGNFGPRSPAQYPAADPNVIAVSATDEGDRLFSASNRGRHVTIAAPGVDILLPAPQANYQVASGTSFAAAHVSGIAALILERQPAMAPDAVRKVMESTARDLGPRGRDDQFGAGLADAYQAIMSIGPKPVSAVTR